MKIKVAKTKLTQALLHKAKLFYINCGDTMYVYIMLKGGPPPCILLLKAAAK
jgi:hypothetical protein